MSADAAARSGMWRDAALLAVIVAVAVGLRTYQLRNEEAWSDEIASLMFLDAPDLDTFLDKVRAEDPAMAPVYYVLEYGWSRVFGTSLTSIRGLSLALGLLCIPMLYAVGRLLLSARAGLLAALIFALSINHIYYAQEIRAYSLATLLALCSVYTFRRLDCRGGARWWSLHIAANALMLFSHLFSVFLLVAEGLFLLLFRRGRQRRLFAWVMVHEVLGLFLAGWLLRGDYSIVQDRLSWIPPTTWKGFFSAFLHFAGGYLEPNLFVKPQLRPYADYLGAVLMAPAAVLAALGLWRRTDEGDRLRFLALWLLVPPLCLLALSHVWKPCFVPRYVLYASLPITLLIAGAVTDARLPWGVRAALTTLTIALCTYAASAVGQAPFRDTRYGEIAAELARAPESDCVVVDDESFDTSGFLYYWPVLRKRASLQQGVQPTWGALQQAYQAGAEVWLLTADFSDKVAQWEAQFNANGVTPAVREFEGYKWGARLWRFRKPGSGP